MGDTGSLRAIWARLNSEEVSEAVSLWTGFAFVLAGIAWMGFSFLYAPSQRTATSISPLYRLRARAVEGALADTFRTALPRVEFLRGGNLDIYITRTDFEAVPFPDRAEAIQRVGTPWCDGANLRFLPAVRIRDVRTGETLGRYSCLLHQLRRRLGLVGDSASSR